MKKSLLSLVFASAIFCSTPAFAINFDKIAGAIESATSSDKKNNPLGKVDEAIGKLSDRIEKRVEKYEKKIDEYEQKMDKAGQALDRVTSTINGLDQQQIEKYLKIAKMAAIGLVLVFVTSFILLIVIFVQVMRINSELKKLRK